MIAPRQPSGPDTEYASVPPPSALIGIIRSIELNSRDFSLEGAQGIEPLGSDPPFGTDSGEPSTAKMRQNTIRSRRRHPRYWRPAREGGRDCPPPRPIGTKASLEEGSNWLNLILCLQ